MIKMVTLLCWYMSAFELKICFEVRKKLGEICDNLLINFDFVKTVNHQKKKKKKKKTPYIKKKKKKNEK